MHWKLITVARSSLFLSFATFQALWPHEGRANFGLQVFKWHESVRGLAIGELLECHRRLNENSNNADNLRAAARTQYRFWVKSIWRNWNLVHIFVPTVPFSLYNQSVLPLSVVSHAPCQISKQVARCHSLCHCQFLLSPAPACAVYNKDVASVIANILVNCRASHLSLFSFHRCLRARAFGISKLWLTR